MAETISPYNPNTRVREIRTDDWPVVDLDVAFDPESDGRRERGEARKKLGAWAIRQVKSWQGDQEIKNQILNGVHGLKLNTHPADVVPYLISIEPVLMLSNLPTEQLAKIETLLDLCCLSISTDLESQREFREAEHVVGAFRLGIETQKARSNIQSSGS